MKKLLFALLLIASMPSMADFDASNTYFGVAGVHAEIGDERADGQMLVAGWSIDEPGRNDSYRVEFQAEHYETDLLTVNAGGLHVLGTLFYLTDNGKFYLDLGINGAKFEALGQSQSEAFFSYGLGYRHTIGPVSIHASYLVDDITEVGGIEIDRPQRAAIGVDYLF